MFDLANSRVCVKTHKKTQVLARNKRMSSRMIQYNMDKTHCDQKKDSIGKKT